MNKKFTAGVVTSVVGLIFLVAAIVVSFVVIPMIIESTVIQQVVLHNGTEQMERFEETPFPLEFRLRVFNISNAAAVLAGAVPQLHEVGPYVYKLYLSRVIEEQNAETITFRNREFYEFDAEQSFPRTENDLVTIVNLPYLAILQTAEAAISGVAMAAFRLYLDDVFGINNSPIATYPVRDLLFNGIKICENPSYLGQIVCSQVRSIGAASRNIEVLSDGTTLFSLLRYKQGMLSEPFEVDRGLQNPLELGSVRRFNGLETLDLWPAEPGGPTACNGTCNMINGTDSMMFAPFLKKESIYALNIDVCRSIELKYIRESSYEGVPTYEYVTGPGLWRDEDCFCSNRTLGVTGSDGCLLPGVLESFPCVGGPVVVSYPHFMHADSRYRNGVIGLSPSEERHQIFLEIEPYTGTPIRAAKRAQFNIFLRPTADVDALSNVRATLVPVVWVEESLVLPEEYLDQLRTDLLASLDLVAIVKPIIIAASSLVLLAGVIFMVTARKRPPPRKQSDHGKPTAAASSGD